MLTTHYKLLTNARELSMGPVPLVHAKWQFHPSQGNLDSYHYKPKNFTMFVLTWLCGVGATYIIGDL